MSLILSSPRRDRHVKPYTVTPPRDDRDAISSQTDRAIDRRTSPLDFADSYFGGVLIGRTLGSRLARRHSPVRLLAIALGITAAGFAILWPSTAPAPALIGLSLMGTGLGNLFPMGVSLAVALAPGQSALASGEWSR
jgi:fucose permease